MRPSLALWSFLTVTALAAPQAPTTQDVCVIEDLDVTLSCITKAAGEFDASGVTPKELFENVLKACIEKSVRGVCACKKGKTGTLSDIFPFTFNTVFTSLKLKLLDKTCEGSS
ncbi:hypothetical protein DE146DRAFT_634650 [Phaeosphaeria sp. MPI-PUGE-AT-0046c]|nr:hypothetical protein DE146DRAFT_634650 [Phaeosphaeria sp. MPI-PUGE-AT-0046c]